VDVSADLRVVCLVVEAGWERTEAGRSRRVKAEMKVTEGEERRVVRMWEPCSGGQ
jgi:hypothetical protein